MTTGRVSTIGVVSDTHGLVRPEVLTALAGCDRIVHAGDIGTPGVHAALSAVAPVVAVRGNVDRGPWADAYPESRHWSWCGLSVLITHDGMAVTEEALQSVDLLISGHSHKPYVGYRHGTRWLNPGSIGPKRFRLPVSLARLHWGDGRLEVEPLVLDDRGKQVVWGPGWRE